MTPPFSVLEPLDASQRKNILLTGHGTGLQTWMGGVRTMAVWMNLFGVVKGHAKAELGRNGSPCKHAVVQVAVSHSGRRASGRPAVRLAIITDGSCLVEASDRVMVKSTAVEMARLLSGICST